MRAGGALALEEGAAAAATDVDAVAVDPDAGAGTLAFAAAVEAEGSRLGSGAWLVRATDEIGPAAALAAFAGGCSAGACSGLRVVCTGVALGAAFGSGFTGSAGRGRMALCGGGNKAAGAAGGADR